MNSQSGDHPKFVGSDHPKHDAVPLPVSQDHKTETQHNEDHKKDEAHVIEPEVDVILGSSKLSSANLLTGFPVFPEGTKSLLK